MKKNFCFTLIFVFFAALIFSCASGQGAVIPPPAPVQGEGTIRFASENMFINQDRTAYYEQTIFTLRDLSSALPDDELELNFRLIISQAEGENIAGIGPSWTGSQGEMQLALDRDYEAGEIFIYRVKIADFRGAEGSEEWAVGKVYIQNYKDQGQANIIVVLEKAILLQ